MTFHLDKGKFPSMNYNRVIKRAQRVDHSMNPTITQPQVMGMYNVMQDVNSLTEPQLAIRKPQGRTRKGLI